MRDPYDDKSNAVFRRLGFKLFVGFFALTFERISSAYWPAFTWLCLFSSVWVSGLVPYSYSFGFFTVSFIFYFGFLYLIRKGWKSFSTPTHADVYRRMELSSGQRHRPTEFFHDKPAGSINKASKALWSLQGQSWLARIPLLRFARSTPVLTQKDPYGIYFIALTLILCSFVIGGAGSFSRLQNGLFPLVPVVKSNLEKELVTVRIIPPEYTRLGETVISGQGSYRGVMSIVEGSEVKIVIRGQSFKPSVTIGNEKLEIEQDPENHDSYTVNTVINTEGKGTLRIRGALFRIFDLPYEVFLDQAPLVSLAGQIEALESGRFAIPLLVSDDYGITNMRVDITKDPEIFDYPLGSEYFVVRSLYAGANNTEEEVKPIYDFTPHTWSGLPVYLNIKISDHSGHTVTLDPIAFTLPERNFSNPAAKYITERRQRLAWAPVGSAATVSTDLENLVYRPELLKSDKVAFLALRTASSRLFYSPTIETAEAVLPLLWKTALRLEDGNISILLDELRQIQQDLENALRDPNTSNEDIAELTQKLQQKMMEYMQALAQRMQDPMSEQSEMNVSTEMLQEMVDTQGLNEFLAEMAESAMNGEREKAKQMLSEFQQLMDSLSAPESMEMPQDVQSMMDTLKGLQELIQQQTELLEQTREDLSSTINPYDSHEPDYGDTNIDKSDNGLDMGNLPPMPTSPSSKGSNNAPNGNMSQGQAGEKGSLDGSSGSPDKGNLLGQQRSGAQDKLKDQLGQLSEDYAQQSGQGTPENMTSASEAMQKSSEQLSKGNGQGSIPHQEQAITDLQNAMQQMGEQLQQRLQGMTIMTLGGSSPGRSGEQSGPFGTRPIEIPEGSQRRRIDDIIDLLRDKSGEWDRPAEERDYYRRLLRKF